MGLENELVLRMCMCLLRATVVLPLVVGAIDYSDLSMM